MSGAANFVAVSCAALRAERDKLRGELAALLDTARAQRGPQSQGN